MLYLSQITLNPKNKPLKSYMKSNIIQIIIFKFFIDRVNKTKISL